MQNINFMRQLFEVKKQGFKSYASSWHKKTKFQVCYKAKILSLDKKKQIKPWNE